MCSTPGTHSLRETRRRLTAVSRLAVYSIEQHIPLDRERVFDPTNIEALTEQLMSEHEAAAASYRSSLRAMGPVLTREAPWPAKAKGIDRRGLAPPYSEPERRRLIQASHRQSTPTKGRVCASTVNLGFGAGLDGRWIPDVKVGHLKDNGRLLLVEVSGKNPRTVPVLKPYRTPLLQLCDGLTKNCYLLTGTRKRDNKNYLSQSLADLDLASDVPALHAGRARSTWLLHHLTVRTRVDVLIRAAGVRSTQLLADLLESLPPISESRAREMLVS